MSQDALAHTLPLGIPWCPGCRPDADPTREILETSYCEPHAVERGGVDDDRVLPTIASLAGGAEADGITCRLMAELLARPR